MKLNPQAPQLEFAQKFSQYLKKAAEYKEEDEKVDEEEVGEGADDEDEMQDEEGQINSQAPAASTAKALTDKQADALSNLPEYR